MIIICSAGGDEKYVLAIPTAAHSPARACRIHPRSIHIYSGEVTASQRICTPRSPAASRRRRRRTMKCDDITTARHRSLRIISRKPAWPRNLIFFLFFLAGSPTWLLKAA